MDVHSDAAACSVPFAATTVPSAGTATRFVDGQARVAATTAHIIANATAFSMTNSSRENDAPDIRDAQIGNDSPPHASSAKCTAYDTGNHARDTVRDPRRLPAPVFDAGAAMGL